MPSVDGLKPQLIAGLVIHEKIVVDARGGSGRYAKIAASKRALEMLKGLPLGEFRKMYGCDCKEVTGMDGLEVDEDIEHGTAI